MNGFNTIAELPGTDLASEIVLLGAASRFASVRHRRHGQRDRQRAR